MSTDPYAPNPQAGAPTLGPFNMNRGGVANPIPGSLVPVNPMNARKQLICAGSEELSHAWPS